MDRERGRDRQMDGWILHRLIDGQIDGKKNRLVCR